MKNKKKNRIMLLLILILGVTIGFALLSTTLFINGTASIKSNTWNIHWDDRSVNVTQGSVSATDPIVSTTTSTKDTVSFDVELELPGDYYEFEIDAINEGSIDGALELAENFITYKSNNVETTLPDYMDFKVVYDDDTNPTTGDVLKASESKTYKIRVEFKSSVEELPEDPEPITIEVKLPYVQHKDACASPVSFSTDSWETIACNVRKGNTSAYNIGDTKEITINNFGTHTVRVANKSTPSECSTTGFSQTSCGFVVEFADIITNNIMNPNNNSGNTDGDGSKGGWEHCQVRGFLNHYLNDFLPSDLNEVIIDTTVISGHGFKDNTNFTTTDKLYLLSTKEVYGTEGTGNKIEYDSAEIETRQLDYYKLKEVTTSNYSEAIKKNNGSNNYWWLRTAVSYGSSTFFSISSSGNWSIDGSDTTFCGVSPAFRIG